MISTKYFKSIFNEKGIIKFKLFSVFYTIENINDEIIISSSISNQKMNYKTIDEALKDYKIYNESLKDNLENINIIE